MADNRGLTAHMIAGRILDREDNIYKKEIIYDILKMYADECGKALLKGERVKIVGVGTIIPEVKATKAFNLPSCNKEDGNPPYTCLKIKRCSEFGVKMNKKLINNMESGIYGLEEVPFTKKQINLLRKNDWIPVDVEVEDEEE